jgi:hypothetical protein
MIKSTDNGATWVGQDTSHSPQGDTRIALNRINNTVVTFDSFFDSLNSYYQFQIFDFTTDTWGPPIGASLNFPLQDYGNRAWMNTVFQYANGDLAIVYDHDSSGRGYGVVYQKYSHNVWGPEIYINTVGSPPNLANVAFDPVTETLYVFCYGTNDDPTGGATCSSVSNTGHVVLNIFSWAAQPDGGDGFGHPMIQDGLIIVPYDNFADPTNVIWIANLSDLAFKPEYLPMPSGEGGFLNRSKTSVGVGGSGYALNNTGFVDTGSGTAEYTIDGVDGSGGVTDFSFLDSGFDYVPGFGVGTTTGGAHPGSGSGFTINIIAIESGTPSCSYCLFPGGYLTIPRKLLSPQFYKRGTAHGA